MPLTALQLRTLKDPPKRIRLFDSNGLYLEVRPEGGRWWRFRFVFGGKEKMLSLGTYPEVSLADARAKRDDMRAQLRNGVYPSIGRGRPGNTVAAIAAEWLAEWSKDKVAGHVVRIKRNLDSDILPFIGPKPIKALSPIEALDVARRVRDRGAPETATRVLGIISLICRYAVLTGRLTSDPCRDLRGAMKTPAAKHFPAPTAPAKVGEILRVLHGYHGSPIVRAALRLGPLVFVRPGELRQAEWSGIDLGVGEWRFKLSKGGADHIVPLSRQAIEILREIQAITGGCRYVFPSAMAPDRAMSDNTVLGALRRLGIGKGEMVGNSWRVTARTMLDEVLGFRVDLIEHQLGHVVRDPLGRAYNRTQHLPERRRMMQAWADYLDTVKAGGVAR